AQAVRRGAGDRDRGARRLGEDLLGLRAALADLRVGADDLDGDVADAEAGRADDARGLGQQRHARRAGPFGAPGAEVLSQVAEARSGEERVAGGVRDDVRVGVPGEPGALALPFQAGAPEFAALLEGVDVGA